MKRDSHSIFDTFELGKLNKITKYLAIIVHGNRAKIPTGYSSVRAAGFCCMVMALTTCSLKPLFSGS
jgi:hypothetical protein